VTTYSPQDARDAIAGLIDTGDVIPLHATPALLEQVANDALQVGADLRRERDELLERLRAIRQTVFPHLREPTQRGDLARTVEAEADPHPEPGAA
jgi:hypothetical protein